MVDISREDRELVRSDLTSLAEFLKKKYAMTIPKIRNFLREMLDVSV